MMNLSQTCLTHSKKEGKKARVMEPFSAQMSLTQNLSFWPINDHLKSTQDTGSSAHCLILMMIKARATQEQSEIKLY